MLKTFFSASPTMLKKNIVLLPHKFLKVGLSFANKHMRGAPLGLANIRLFLSSWSNAQSYANASPRGTPLMCLLANVRPTFKNLPRINIQVFLHLRQRQRKKSFVILTPDQLKTFLSLHITKTKTF